MKKSFGILLNDDVNKKEFIESIIKGDLLPDLKILKGKVFSEDVLLKAIQEEKKHEHYLVKEQTGKQLSDYSSGEQKKIFLNYLLEKKPDFLVADNIFDNLDIKSQQLISEEFKQLNSQLIIIQLANRADELLAFIETKYFFIDGALEDYSLNETQKTSLFSGTLPKSKAIELFYPMIQLTNVCVNYEDKCILNNISWSLNSKEFWQLKGSNGSGKSTLLSLIYGNNPKGFGQNIYLFGRKKGSGESIWDIKKKIGYFSSTLVLGFEKQETVLNMVLGGFYDSVGLYRKALDTDLKTAYEWLKILGLETKKDTPFSSLSLGVQRQILLIRALVKQPELIILDEPTVGLDDSSAAIFCDLLNKIASETDAAIIYVSHKNEPGLKPQHIIELIPSKNGSSAIITY